MMNPSAESIQEFRVEANGYPAEFGRSAGGLIHMTTRSGTNTFHGAASEFVRNDAFDARTFFAPGKAPLRYNIYGVSAGGPIRRRPRDGAPSPLFIPGRMSPTIPAWRTATILSRMCLIH